MAYKCGETMAIRINEKLKNDFKDFCDRSGMTVSGAVKLLVYNTINKQQIPFQVVAADNGEIYSLGGTKYEKRTTIRIGRELNEGFTKVCETIGVSRSGIIKMFMVNCVVAGKLPF